ncbi:MAG TPA: hypothetical protein P5522_08625 [Spirochaetia bacterium]|nr:hypothetical protein [Spirochaetia bacterium]
MNITVQKNIYQDWIDAKEAERLAIERRREIEDRIVAEFEIPETLEGTRTVEASVDETAYTVKIVGRMNRKINADELQEVAREAGLDSYLGVLFRWKPEIIAAAWKAADKSITSVLEQAITTEPGRPSFSIERKEEKGTK